MRALLIILFSTLVFSTATNAQVVPPSPSKDYVLISVFLRHDQSKTLDQIQQELEDRKFWTSFPPPGVEIDSWYVMMGIGQVVVLRVPPEKLREVNRVIEQKAWSAFRTEFYPTYDFREFAKALRQRALEAK